MDNQKFVELAKKAVVYYFNCHRKVADGGRLTSKDVLISWTCALSNRVLLKTTISEEMRYEVFCDDGKNMYIEVYKNYEKVDSECINIIMCQN